MTNLRSYLALAAAIVFLASPAAIADKLPAGGNESLGGQLLDDLPQESNQPAATQNDLDQQKSTREIEDSLKESTPLRGFGASANPIAQPLARVQGSMKQAQGLLAKTAAETKTGTPQLAGPVQEEIISELDKLIAELSKQCNGQCQGGGGQEGKQPPKPGQNSQANSKKSGSAAGRGKSAARDSSDRLDRSSAKPVDKGEVNEIVKALWGNLPERSREQMLQSFSDEFLPKYELEIEQYYRRLSEEDRQSQPK